MERKFSDFSEKGKNPYFPPKINISFVEMQNCIAASVVVLKETEFEEEDLTEEKDDQPENKN